MKNKRFEELGVIEEFEPNVDFFEIELSQIKGGVSSDPPIIPVPGCRNGNGCNGGNGLSNGLNAW